MNQPKEWKCPTDWHPDSDGEWEIEMLSRLASVLIEYDSSLNVELNLNDPTCAYFYITRDKTKLGEVYVNRKEAESDEPMYSIFYNLDETEYHGSSTTECVQRLVGSNGFPIN
ncbi:hypothetical protein NBRC116493_02760 [Aurantivibrio infirmus]